MFNFSFLKSWPKYFTISHWYLFFQTRKCHVCSLVANSHIFLPPQLKGSRHVDLDLVGDWVSSRCETRQYGQFLTRQLSFYPDGSSWSGQYDFYRDPLCLNPSFTLKIKGTYTVKADSKTILGAKNCNFRVHNLKIKPMSQMITENLNIFGGQSCGKPKSWETFIEQDVTSSGGCGALGIVLPTVEHELLKIEKKRDKSYLYIGQRPTAGGSRPVKEWPTSFQEPLLQCAQSASPPIKVKFKVQNRLPFFQRLQSIESSSADDTRSIQYVTVLLVVLSFFSIRILWWKIDLQNLIQGHRANGDEMLQLVWQWTSQLGIHKIQTLEAAAGRLNEIARYRPYC